MGRKRTLDLTNLTPERRSLYELARQSPQIQVVLCLERRLSDLMLLAMMGMTKADAPLVRGLDAHAAISAAADVCAVDLEFPTIPHAASVPSNPVSMRRARPASGFARLDGQARRKAYVRQVLSPAA
jgi:hypothetical protein